MLTYAALPIRGPSRYMSATPAKPPLIWANALMFAITFAVAAVLVPWYGLKYGFTGADWGIFAFFLIANGMSITGVRPANVTGPDKVRGSVDHVQIMVDAE